MDGLPQVAHTHQVVASQIEQELLIDFGRAEHHHLHNIAHRQPDRCTGWLLLRHSMEHRLGRFALEQTHRLASPSH
jgi:hypothetical protein